MLLMRTRARPGWIRSRGKTLVDLRCDRPTTGKAMRHRVARQARRGVPESSGGRHRYFVGPEFSFSSSGGASNVGSSCKYQVGGSALATAVESTGNWRIDGRPTVKVPAYFPVRRDSPDTSSDLILTKEPDVDRSHVTESKMKTPAPDRSRRVAHR